MALIDFRAINYGNVNFITLKNRLPVDSGSIIGTLPFSSITGTVPLTQGGTGQTSALAAFNALKQAATTTDTGVIEQATEAEGSAGTSNTVFPSVLTVKNMITTHDPSKAFMSAYSAVNQAAPLGVWTKIILGTEAYDVGANFASSTFVVPVTGYYKVNGCISYTATTSMLTASLAIYVNSNPSRILSQMTVTSGRADILSGSADLFLPAGATIELYGYLSGTGTLQFDAGTSTRMDISGI